jgi:hypothetical protein
MNPDPPSEPPDEGDPPADRSAEAWRSAARDRADRLHQRPAQREERKPWFQQLPAKLAGGVVFLVALTTLLGNLLELREKGRDVLPAVAPAPASSVSSGSETASSETAGTASAPAPSATPSGPVRLRVVLDRIAVRDDGSPGTTDWRFTVEADGQPLLAFEQDDLDDTGGRNVVRPKDLEAVLRLPPGRPAQLAVKGWRLSRLRLQGQPDAVGEGVLPVDGAEAAIQVAAPEASGGAFVFYFSTDQP